MSDVINLKQFRKRKSRDDKAQLADENRIRFGRTKAEKLFDHDKTTKDIKFLEQNKLDHPETDPPDIAAPDKQSSSSREDLP